MDREQIVKAMECCKRIGEHPHNCGGCPLPNALHYRDRVYCRAFLAQQALALIREQDERIAAFVIMLNKAYELCKKAKADTVRMMQERLKEKRVKPEFPWDDFFITETDIDQVAKEMLEEAK